MSLFDKQRLNNAAFKLDIERMRKGWYSDKYFTNIATMLTVLSADLCPSRTWNGFQGLFPSFSAQH